MTTTDWKHVEHIRMMIEKSERVVVRPSGQRTVTITPSGVLAKDIYEYCKEIFHVLPN